MAIDNRYVASRVLQQLMRDKDTGLPLSDGYIEFKKDNSRTDDKPVFQITGSPPNYSYIALPNPLTLTDFGSIADVIYYFPYDADGNVERYFIQVFNSVNVLQFSLEAWPPGISADDSDGSLITNIAGNGQFLLHTDLPATDTLEAGEIRADVTPVAYGGWTFQRSAGSVATDFVTFPRFGSYTDDPIASPRYKIQVNRTVQSLADAEKDLDLTFTDVNKFASTTQEFTFGMTARSESGGNQSVQLILYKNFGTGGSAPTEVVLTTFSLAPSFSIFNYSFTFGINDTKTIGALNDDYLQLRLRPSGSNTWNYSLTDVVLVEGQFMNAAFPDTTNAQFQYRSLPPALPQFNNGDLALPMILGRSGFQYDYSQIGKVFSGINITPEFGELACDGASYEYIEQSADGIPYSRLGNKLFVSGANAYRFGGGNTYVNSYYAGGASDELIIGNNTFGTATATNAGTSGFTVATIHPASTTTYAVNAYVNASNVLYIQNKEYGAVANSTAATSTFTVTQVLNNGVSRAVTSVVTQPATGLGGLYFTFESLVATVATPFYVWFKVNGAGSDPTPGGTGIEVDLNTADTATMVAFKIQLALSGGLTSRIVLPAFAGVTAGTYWTFNTPAQAFYVWYQKNGAGPDPAVSSAKPIPVNVVTGDTAAQIAFKTQTAVNAKYFGTPNLAGLFIRVFDSAGTVNVEGTSSWSITPGLSGNTIGAIQLDEFQSHLHSYAMVTTGSDVVQSGADTPIFATAATPTSATGGVESRGLNMSLNYVIKY